MRYLIDPLESKLSDEEVIARSSNQPGICNNCEACIYFPRYTSLTRLELSRSLLLKLTCGEHEGPWDLPALLELHLDDMLLTGFWMTFIATSLTTLTQLTFASCLLDGDFEIVAAADSVR